jgi:hypothetical protein
MSNVDNTIVESAAPAVTLVGKAAKKGKTKGSGQKGEITSHGKDKTLPKDKVPHKGEERATRRVTIEDADSGPMVVDLECKEPKELRAESKRGQLLQALQDKGMTLAQGCSRFEWKPRDFADALRLLAKVNGVHTKRDESGRWHVTNKKVAAAALKEAAEPSTN